MSVFEIIALAFLGAIYIPIILVRQKFVGATEMRGVGATVRRVLSFMFEVLAVAVVWKSNGGFTDVLSTVCAAIVCGYILSEVTVSALLTGKPVTVSVKSATYDRIARRLSSSSWCVSWHSHDHQGDSVCAVCGRGDSDVVTPTHAHLLVNIFAP